MPDVVVMDLSMPGLNGLEATKALKRQCPGIKVLAFTRHAESGYARELLRLGASGYVCKHRPSVEFLNAIRAVATGGTYLDSEMAGRLIDERPLAQPDDRDAGAPALLTARETEVVRLVAGGYSNQEVAARLGVSVKTVESHKSNAMQKLGWPVDWPCTPGGRSSPPT
jgi:two-component system response regulator NreC